MDSFVIPIKLFLSNYFHSFVTFVLLLLNASHGFATSQRLKGLGLEELHDGTRWHSMPHLCCVLSL
jgi:hypothetical protein